MTTEFDKKINVAKCQHCNKITDITMSDTIKKMRVQKQALEEELQEAHMNKNRIRKHKIGQIQAMHIMVKKLYDLMTPEQRTTAYGYSKELRDEFNKIKKIQ